MKTTTHSWITRTLIATALLGLCLSSRAATNTWNGGGAPDGNWQNAANWGGISIAPLDQLIFDGSTQTLSTNNFTAGTIFGNIDFPSTAGAFSLSGNSLILTNGLDGGAGATYGGNITNSSASTETVSLPLTFSAGKHIITTDPGSGQLSLSGAITRNTGGGLEFLQTGGPINVAGPGLANINGILGGGAHISTGSGFLDWAALDGGNNIVAYSSYTDFASGAIANNSASNVRLIGDSAAYTAANGTTINSINSQLGAARNLTVTGVLRLGAKGGILANGSGVLTVTGGSVTTAGSGGELSFLSVPGGVTGRLAVSSTVTNDTGNAPVTVNVQGYITLSGANTFSGGCFIYNNGRVSTGNGLCFGTGPVKIFPGGEVFFNNGASFTNSFDIAGTGSTEANGGITGPGAYRVASTAVISGKTTFHGKTRISTSAAGGAISGQISGDSQLELATFANDNSALLLSNSNNAANDWSGGTLINSLAASRKVIIRLGANEQIPDGAGKGDLTINGPDVARLDLNGKNETLNGLIAGASANYQITNGGATASILTLGNNNANGAFGGTIKDTGFASNSLSIVKIGTGTQTLSGASSYVGSTTVKGGRLVFTGGASIATTAQLTVTTNGTVDLSDIVPMTLPTNNVAASNGTFAVALVSGGSAITTPTLLVGGDTNFISVTSIPAVSTYPAQFTIIKATNSVLGTLNFGLAGALPVSPSTPFAGFVSNNVANNSVDVVITAGPTSIRWAGYDGSSLNTSWDGSTMDWKTFPGALTAWLDGNFANFDDTASNATVSINQTVSPAGITVSSSTLNYSLGGGGGITGSGGLTKQGSSTLTLNNTGVNDFAGDISILTGALQLGNNDGGGNIPATANLIDNGALIFKRSDGVTVSNIISGAGSVTVNGSGTVNLSGGNTFNGPVSVSVGTLQLGNNSALGTTNGGTTVSAGGTLDIGLNTINVGQELVTISGAGVNSGGALINSSGSATFTQPNLARLVLAGDASVGGPGRMDLRAATTANPTLASLVMSGGSHKLTKVGAGQFGIVGCTVDNALGDIDVQAGILSIEVATTSLGNPANSLTVESGATFAMFQCTNALNKNFIIADGATVFNNNGVNTIAGPMTLQNAGGFCTFNVAGTSLNLAGALSGNGILYKSAGTAPLTISGNSSNFTGGILESIGSIILTGTLTNGLGVHLTGGSFAINGALLGASATGGITNDNGASLSGTGVSTAPADVLGNLLPGGSNTVGTLTLGGLIVEGSAALYYDLGYATNSGGAANDLIVVNGDLTLNGGSITINPVALLRKGPAYKYLLLSYTGTLVNNAAPSLTIPQNYTGTLDFSTPGQVNLLVSGGPAVWDGGSPADGNWSDQLNWGNIPISGGSTLYFDGNTRTVNTNDTAASTVYQDVSFNVEAGPFTLKGNDIGLNGNLVNTSTNAQTILFPMSSSGPNNTFNGGTNGPLSKLIIGGGWTNTSSGLSSNTLVGVGTWTNLFFTVNPGITNTISLTDTNANWTMMDNASSAAMTNPVIIDVQSGTFSFGSGSSAPTLATTSSGVSRVGVATNGPAVFNMNNGTLTFAGRLNTGTAAGTVATINQSGGTLDCQALLQISDGAATASTTLNVSGGTLNVGTPTAQSLFLCSRGTGICNVTLSGVLRCGTFDVSRDIGPTYGKVNIDGGRIEANRFGTATSSANGAAGAVAILNFNGGTVRARQNSATFIQGGTGVPITCTVRSGGAIIDDAGFDVAVQEPLQHDAGLGATLDGGLIKNGTGTLTLAKVNTYTGPTVVNAGTLSISGAIAGSGVNVTASGTLGGSGTVGTNVTVNGTVAPGTTAAIGTLTVTNGNVTLAGNALFKVNRGSAPSNDVLRCTGTITEGGSITVTNTGGTLRSGDTFTLLSGTLGGSFSGNTLPALWPGLSWDSSALNSAGRITVAGTLIPPTISSVSSTPTSFGISGTGGLAGATYYVLASTNVALPISTWTRLATNTFDNLGHFSYTDNSGLGPQRFYTLQVP